MCWARTNIAALLSLGAFALAAPLTVAAQQDKDQVAFFEARIRPMLVEFCYECHSEKADSVSGGLRLDYREGWQTGGDTGPAVVPKNAEQSLLIQAIDPRHVDLQMPPDDPLPADVIADFRRWIDSGAIDPRESSPNGTGPPVFDLPARRSSHWAWQPLSTSLPDASIDDFIERKVVAQGLPLGELAKPATLLRRLSFDLIGLPPTVHELRAFQKAWRESRERAIEQTVDRLLADPRFGEHWTRHWLDVVRFSETKGHVTDQERPFAWKYRDYMIEAFNRDLPYDRLLLEHLAGDLLPRSEHRPGRLGESNVAPTATGFLFMHEMHFMSVDPIKQRWDEINAQIDVVGKAFLGLTIECARCHDHKFDAISQRDYYALAGFFYSTEQGRARTAPRSELLENSEELAQREQAYESFLTNKRKQRRSAQQPKAAGEYFPISDELGIQSPGDTAKLIQLMSQVQELDPSWVFWVRSAEDVEGTDVALRIRGEHHNKGEIVPRRFLEAVTDDPPPESSALGKGSGRLWLAQQVASADNPLTARVWVNRLWHHLMGTGLVRTPNNFGVQGIPPTHPELLDFLANQLIDSGWSTKSVIRSIVLSRAYQRASSGAGNTGESSDSVTQRQREMDPQNVFYAYRPTRRLTAEQLRDAMLAVAGSLDETQFGPSIDCFVSPDASANKPSNIPKSGPLDGANRRSVYLKIRRNFYDPFLVTFDFPDRGKSAGRRSVTNSSRQALAMLNSPLVHELAHDWGARLAARNDAFEDKVVGMWQRALSRSPSDREIESMQTLFHDLGDELSPVEKWKHIAHVVFNHPEFMYLD